MSSPRDGLREEDAVESALFGESLEFFRKKLVEIVVGEDRGGAFAGAVEEVGDDLCLGRFLVLD